MIVAIVGIVHEHDLLPYYFEHYRRIGVERFVVACDPLALDPSGTLAEGLSAAPDVTVVELPRAFQRSSVVGMVEEEVRLALGKPDDWLIPADLDELNQYPDSLPNLVRELERGGYTHVTGIMKDRVAESGELTPLRPFEEGVSLWDQYPLEARVTERITRGCIDKVLISRGDLHWWMGHHRMRDADRLRPLTATGAAHHFKWRSTLLKTLDWRVENEQRRRIPWSEESLRLSEYLRERGRIGLEDVAAEPGWRPGRRSIDA